MNQQQSTPPPVPGRSSTTSAASPCCPLKFWHTPQPLTRHKARQKPVTHTHT